MVFLFGRYNVVKPLRKRVKFFVFILIRFYDFYISLFLNFYPLEIIAHILNVKYFAESLTRIQHELCNVV